MSESDAKCGGLFMIFHKRFIYRCRVNNAENITQLMDIVKAKIQKHILGNFRSKKYVLGSCILSSSAENTKNGYYWKQNYIATIECCDHRD